MTAYTKRSDTMKLYRIELTNRWGERYVVTVPGKSLYEVLRQLTLAPGWQLECYSIVGVSA